jgi:hypothetical protein
MWDFGQRMLAFVRNGHRVLWTMTSTSPHAALHTMSTDLMEELLIKFSPLFQEPAGLPPPRSHGAIAYSSCLAPRPLSCSLTATRMPRRPS